MEHAEAAACIGERMKALQDRICSSGETGNQAAETVWRSVCELLKELEAVPDYSDTV